MKEVNQIVEGVHSAKAALGLAKKYGVKEQETIIFVSSNSKNNKSNAMKILQVE